ncbi:LacI family DNA-binding transcriptional regulator [Microbacterium sp. GXF7504]
MNVMGDTPSRVGVRQVAERAGVSTQTVSRVLNGHPNIREETRRRVLEAMAELDYRVNNAARALGTRSSRTLGVIASEASLYGPAAAITELENAAREAGRWIVTAYTDAEDPASVRQAVDHLLGQGVDGIVLVALHERARDTVAERAAGVRVLAFHDDAGLAAQGEAAQLVVDHLVAAGHRRIARVGGPPAWLEERARAAGHADALRSHGLAPAGEWRGDWSAASGSAVAARIAGAVAAGDGPTALVVANDQMALGVIAGLDAAGLSVPADMSVVGFDDNPDAAYYRPALTTVRVDLAGQARRCVAAALDVPVPDAETLDVAPVLLVRASTAPLAR